MIEQTHIVLGMVIGLVAMLLMAGFIVVFVVMYQRRQIAQEKRMNEVQRDYQRSLLETALDSEETERRRMAGELHDDIGVMLSLTKMSVNQLDRKSGHFGEEEKLLIGRVKDLLEETMMNVRRISKALVPSTLEQFGLEAAIEDLVGKLSHTGSPEVLFMEAKDAIPRQPPKTELALFRIAQELLNNAIKHAGATVVRIELFSSSGFIQLTVEDNGAGFDAVSVRESKKAGLGLRNIESRLSIINGTATYNKLAPGTSVNVKVPLALPG